MKNVFKILSTDNSSILRVYGKNVTHITIPNGITTIGMFAFSDCSALQSIDIPNSITSISPYAFYKCSSLTNINVVDDNMQYCSIDGILFSKDLTTLIKFPNGRKVTKYKIPQDATTIGAFAFSGCSALQSIDIHNSVTTIGNSAFAECSALQSINIPNSITKISSNAFYKCSSLTNINVVDDNMQYCSIDGILFSKTLTTLIKLPNGRKVTKYKIPQDVTTIGAFAFSGCSALQSIDIHNSVTSIGASAFRECSALQNINIPKSVTTIENSAFAECTALQSIDIPKSVTTIESNSLFYKCSTLQSIDIPNSVTTIGNSAFAECSALQSIDIPNSVTTIEFNAFYGCSEIESIDIPNSVTKIGKGAFSECSHLKDIHIHWAQMNNIQVDDYAFVEKNRINIVNCTLYIPFGTRWTYRHHPVFGKFKNIVTEKKLKNDTSF